MNNYFFGFWDSNKVIDKIQLTQINLWAKSILFFNKNAIVYLYTKKTIIPDGINIKNLEIVYLNNFEILLKDTPLDGYKINNSLSKPELSDIIRLALLYKYGGTWLDVDDIVVRQFPEEKNILGTFLWENKKQASYWGSTFNLIHGSLVCDKYKNYGFHIQNDPMINWDKGNKFLFTWMENIQKYKSSDWGQKLPTEIIRINTSIINDCNVTLLPQHHLLLHPAFGSQAQFGNANRKGPMFPPYDLRITGKVNYDDMITKGEFWEVVKQTLEKHDYCCVKNSKNTGIIQCNEGKDKRWFIGHLCDWKNIENIPQSTASINLEGGLGNQLFKIFCLISYCNTYNKKYIFNRKLPNNNNNKIDTRNTYWDNLLKSISENTYDKRDFKYQYSEKRLYEYNEIPYYEKDILLKGYYQNYKYFEKKYDEIINILNLNEIQENIKNKYLKNENIISLHFRKGDYKNLDNYIVLNICYYIEAIRYVLDKDTSKCSEILCVYEIQDEEEVCKMIEELQDIFTEIKFIKVSTDLQDWEQMILMSVCRHNIIANSTFSWWSAYINKNVDKIVCYPEKWFVKPTNISGMFPDKWKMIKNDSILTTGQLLTNNKHKSIKYDFNKLKAKQLTFFKNKEHEMNVRIQNLKDVINIFNESGIFYWLQGKTLLGMVRDNRLIEKDHDEDIGTMCKNINKICLIVIPKLNKIGFEVIRATENNSMVSVMRDFRYIDICFFVNKEDKIGYENKWFNSKLYKSFTNININNFNYSVPAEYREICKFSYDIKI